MRASVLPVFIAEPIAESKYSRFGIQAALVRAPLLLLDLVHVGRGTLVRIAIPASARGMVLRRRRVG
jgi:hypothetical protein